MRCYDNDTQKTRKYVKHFERFIWSWTHSVCAMACGVLAVAAATKWEQYDTYETLVNKRNDLIQFISSNACTYTIYCGRAFVHMQLCTISHYISRRSDFIHEGFAHATWLPDKIIVRLIWKFQYELALIRTIQWAHQRFNSLSLYLHFAWSKMREIHTIFTWNAWIRFTLGKLHLNWMTAACFAHLCAHPLYSCAKYLIFRFSIEISWNSHQFWKCNFVHELE